MLHSYESAPASWRPRLCPHTGREKQWPKVTDTLSLEKLLIASNITMQVCECGGYESTALRICSKCKLLKPMNFAHPFAVPLAHPDIRCWECLEGYDNELYGVNVYDGSSYSRVSQIIPPPVHFKEVEISDSLFDFEF